MAQERPTTPEKQLLKLIEDPREQDLQRTKIKRKSFNLFSSSALRGRLSFLLASVRSGSFGEHISLDVGGLNKGLKIIIVALIIYLVGSFVVSIGRLKQVPDFVSQNAESFQAIPVSEPLSRDISFYLKGPQSRDIFQFSDSTYEEAQEGSDEVALPSGGSFSKAKLLAQRLSLVGISWFDDPDVMIEDTSTQKIHFLKHGEMIDDLIKVEAIFQDKVILTYDEGEELELK